MYATYMLLFYSSAISNRIEGTTLLFLIVKRYNSVIRLSHSKVNKKYKYKLVQSSPCINKKQNSLPPLQLTPEICAPPLPTPHQNTLSPIFNTMVLSLAWPLFLFVSLVDSIYDIIYFHFIYESKGVVVNSENAMSSFQT